jgi:predicted alpha/beta hydrolase family esterase
MSAPTITWLVLVAATLGSFATAELLSQRAVAVAIILLVAAFKVRLILHRFMDLRSAPFSWRATFDVWTAACTAMIVGLTWYAMAA